MKFPNKKFFGLINDGWEDVEKMQKNEFLKGKKDHKTQLIDFAIEVVKWHGEFKVKPKPITHYETNDNPPLKKAFKILFDNKITKDPNRVYVREIESYEVSK